MTLKDAMQARHTVRRYLNKPIPAEIIAQLNERAASCNSKLGLAIEFVAGDSHGVNTFGSIMSKGADNYFALCGNPAPDLDERLGYASSDLMLFAQTLGLNTWWVGGTYNKKNVLSKVAKGLAIAGILITGFGENQGIPHKSKAISKVYAYNGEPPAWFMQGIEAALLAPTALNRQSFFIEGDGNTVGITCNNGAFSGVDKGIVKHHFELGAGSDNFSWK